MCSFYFARRRRELTSSQITCIYDSVQLKTLYGQHLPCAIYISFFYIPCRISSWVLTLLDWHERVGVRFLSCIVALIFGHRDVSVFLLALRLSSKSKVSLLSRESMLPCSPGFSTLLWDNTAFQSRLWRARPPFCHICKYIACWTILAVSYECRWLAYFLRFLWFIFVNDSSEVPLKSLKLLTSALQAKFPSHLWRYSVMRNSPQPFSPFMCHPYPKTVPKQLRARNSKRIWLWCSISASLVSRVGELAVAF